MPQGTIRRAIRAVLDGEGVGSAAVNATFLSVAKMRVLNRRTFGRDRATDVIAFPLPHPAHVVGDIYICPEASRQLERPEWVPQRQETIRLVIHGTLHVLGYDHPDRGDRTQTPMWRRQERYVERLTHGGK